VLATPVSLARILLGSEGDERGVFGGKGERFVIEFVLQGLAPPKNGGEGLNRDADIFVYRLLRGDEERGLRVKRSIKEADLLQRTFRHDGGPEDGGRGLFGVSSRRSFGIEGRKKSAGRIHQR